MYLVCHTVNRTARTLLMLVIMLASQGIASVHSYDAFQTDDCLDVCSVCVIGQGLDAAVEACPSAVHLDSHAVQRLFQSSGDRPVSPVNFYSSRAPPTTLIKA
jgi:hypothetical protein